MTVMGDMSVFEAIHSLRAMRRLKPDAVPDDVLHKVLDAGTQAPSGQNTQPWRFLVVRDPESKTFLQRPDEFGMVAIIPIGYPRGRFGPVRREPAAAKTFYDRWGASRGS